MTAKRRVMSLIEDTMTQVLVVGNDALCHRFAGPDSSAVIADMRSELHVAQQINSALTRRFDTQSNELADLRSQLNIMTLERDRLLDLSKQSTAFTASLRKSVAELEAQAAVTRSQADGQVAAAIRHADGFKRQVEDRDQEIAALRVAIADRDRAYADLQGVASKHFAQLQESAQLLVDGGSQPFRHTQSVIAHQRAVILRQKRVIARQGSIPMHDPHIAAAAAGGLDAPGLSPSDLQLNARLCRILAERFPEAMEIPSGETRVLELRIGSRQGRALTAPPGSSSPRQASGRTAQPSSIGLAALDVDSAGGSSQPRRTLAQLHRARLNTLTPAEKLHRLSHPVSATPAGSRRKPHQPPDQPYSIPLPGEEGHEEVTELLAGDDLGAVSDGELLRLSAASSRRRRHRRRASSSVTPSSAARVARPASPVGDETAFDFDLGDPMEDVELDAFVEVGVSVTSSAGAVSTTGTSSVVAATSSPVTATSSTTVTTVVSAARTVDSAVVSCSAPQDSSVSMATSSSAATASSSAVLVSTSSWSTESAFADSSVPTSLPMAPSAAGLSSSCSTASTIGLASSAGLDVSTSILFLAPFPTSWVVTSAPSSAGPVMASAPVLSSTLTPTPLSSTALVASSTASSTVMSIPASSSAVITAPMTSSAAIALPVAGSVGVSTSAPGPVGSISVSTPNSAMLRVLGCSRQTPALKPSGAASTVVTAVPEVSSTSTRPTVPVSDSVMVSPSARPRRKPAAIAASLSSHYLTELSVSDRVALGLGGSAESSSDSTSRGAGSSAKPLELLSGSSDAESDGRRLSDLENSAGSAGDADHPRRSKRLVSSDAAVRSRPSKKSHRDLPPCSSRLSNHSAGASPVVPSSQPSTTASVGVTPHPGVHSTPALPAVLRVAYSTLQTRAAQAASRNSRITPQNAWLHDLPFFHFGSARCWKAILERKTGQLVRAGGDRSRISPTPSSLDGLRAFADVYNPDHPSQLLRRLLPASPTFVSPLRLSDWCQAVLEVDSAEPWRELGGSASDSAATARSARDARDGSDGSPSDSIFGPDSPDLAGSLNSALGSSVGTSSQVSGSAGQRSRMGNSAGHSVQGQYSAMDMLVNAASAISQAPSPNAPVTL
ncbi:unnamed protein product [Phytophthora fragariaefolia]|uniref:Unnamed protein product n=1 Tax=Phytophthora fragariaefolia TaxID=1490495 RepID=A0A9W6XSF9_9STRA|nr:unnamed protein product [Phytophthora fragariaefolia]